MFLFIFDFFLPSFLAKIYIILLDKSYLEKMDWSFLAVDEVFFFFFLPIQKKKKKSKNASKKKTTTYNHIIKKKKKKKKIRLIV